MTGEAADRASPAGRALPVGGAAFGEGGLEPTSVIVSAEELRAFTERVLVAAGMRRLDAAAVAEALVWADLRGIEAHGVARLPLCVERLRAGGSRAETQPVIVAESATTALLDARDALGQVAGVRAMELAIARARRQHLGAVVVRNSGSLGALGYYPLLAARQELIGLIITNSMPLLAPWGGARKLLGNQAYAIACPAGRHPPLLLDTSTSATSWAQVRLAREQGQPLEPGLALDRDGQPTTDPAAALEGLLLPAGGHKGYGLALLWEVLTGVLAGGAFAPDVGSPEAVDRPQHVAHFALALDPTAFLPLADFKARVDELIERVHCVPPAAGGGRVRVPGERGAEVAAAREREGIPLPARRLAALQALAEQLGVQGLVPRGAAPAASERPADEPD